MNLSRIGARQITSLGIRHIFRFRQRQVQHLSRRSFSYTCARSTRRNNVFDDDQFDINVFEDEVGGPARKRRRLTSEEIERDVNDGEIEDDNIINLEKSLESFGLSDEEEEDVVREVFTQDEIDHMQQQSDRALSMQDFTSFTTYHILPRKQIPKQSQLYLNKLNESLDEVGMSIGKPERLQEDIWRWYTRSKDNVPDLVSMVPREGWERIWTSQAVDSPTNPDRIVHLKTLAQDRESAGWELSQQERLMKIEGTFLEGKQQAALDLFEESLLHGDAETAQFLEIGVRMYSLNGNTVRAEALVDQLFAFNRMADPRVITSLVCAYAARRDEISILRAWSLFQELQRRLSSDMRMEDYDTVALGFLESGHKDFALAVFRDMMLHGQKEKMTGIHSSFTKLKDFVSLGHSSRESTEISLDAIKYLPRRFQNKYFYASWLRKLLSEGQTNAAAQVVELMYERSVKPDAKHVNGLIAAWLRSRRSFDKDRAEELGWTMVQRRLDFCTERRRTQTDTTPDKSSMASRGFIIFPEGLSVNENSRGLRVPINISRPVPAASIETFCILLQFYLRRGWYNHVRHLRDLLDPAELSLNSFFMNHLLYAELRTKGYRRAWTRFESMTRTVYPDMETWVCLWECEKQHVHDVRNTDLSGFPMPRDLFGRMIAWLDGLRGQAKTNALADFDESHYHEIVRCFCYAKDLEGCFVAIHTVHRLFGFTPTESLVRSMLMMMSKLLPPRTASIEKQMYPQRYPRRQRAKWKLRQEYERDMAHATYLLDTTRKERVAGLARHDVLFEDLSSDSQALENHKVCLGILLRIMEERRADGRVDVKLHAGHPPIQRAAEEMGLERIDVADALKITLGDEI